MYDKILQIIEEINMFRRWFVAIITVFLTAAVSFSATTAKWWDSAVFYQIFPLSYLDTDGNGTGDINGITSKLDYITNLGITAIWLTPIHPHPVSFYHGYAVNDYYAVNPILGTMQDFEKLIKEAHARGVKIVMDLVMNHTSVSNQWFIESMRNNPTYANWYVWKANDPGGWPNASGNSQMPSWHKLNMPVTPETVRPIMRPLTSPSPT
jgi:glycosidase